MKSINKSHIIDANGIIDPYLAYARAQHWFVSRDLYQHFSVRWGKRRLVDNILLPEQDCRCCYCQKHLKPSNDPDATIEHLIPRSTTQGADFTHYFSVKYPGLNAANVCHTRDYKNGTNAPNQYPHHVAYHNFAVACHDCNEARGNEDIAFPFLLRPSDQHVNYNRATGRVNWYDDPKLFEGVDEKHYMVNKSGLNRPLLKAIRAVWLYGKDHPTHSYSTPDTVHNDAERKELIYRTFGAALDADADFSTQDLEGFLSLQTRGVWNLLLRYDYFSNI